MNNYWYILYETLRRVCRSQLPLTLENYSVQDFVILTKFPYFYNIHKTETFNNILVMFIF